MKKIMLLLFILSSSGLALGGERAHAQGRFTQFNPAEQLGGSIDTNSPEYWKGKYENERAEKNGYANFIRKSVKNASYAMTIGDMMQRGFNSGVTNSIAELTHTLLVGGIAGGALMISTLAYDMYETQKAKASGLYAQKVAMLDAQIVMQAEAQLFGGVIPMEDRAVKVPGAFQVFDESIKYASDPELKSYLRETHGKVLTQTLTAFSTFSPDEHQKNMATATEITTLLAHVKHVAEEKKKLTEVQQELVQKSINTDLNRAQYLLHCLAYGERYNQPGYTSNGKMVEDAGKAVLGGTAMVGIAAVGYVFLNK